MIPLWLLAGAALQAGVPPPLPKVSADCAHPVYASDQLVCDDPGLLALDQQLVAVLARLPAKPVAGPLIEDQEAWFRRSRQCAFRPDHSACVAQAYRDRIAVLVTETSPVSKPTGRCSRADMVMAAGNDSSVILTLDGEVIAVATAARPAWQPFVSYRRSGYVTTLRDLTGAVIVRCRSKEK